MKTETDRQKLFSPHAAPALERCVFFRGLNLAGYDGKRKAQTEEGDTFHRDCYALFTGAKRLHDFPKSKRAKMKWAIEVQRRYCLNPLAVEEQVDLFDRDQQWVTNGTADLAGWNENRLAVIDWKPGDYIDRWAQVIIYGLGWMDRHSETVCQCTLAYYKTRQVEQRSITYKEAEERVYKLIARLRGEAGPEYHAINEWCGMCSVRLSEAGCPAWEEHRALLAESGWPRELDERIAAIKSDPEKLARFIIADRRWRTLVDAHELDDIMKKELEKSATRKAYGLKLQSRGYSIVIDNTQSSEPPKQLEE